MATKEFRKKEKTPKYGWIELDKPCMCLRERERERQREFLRYDERRERERDNE